MIWQGYAKRLKDVLALEGSPIAVTYSMQPLSKRKKGKHWVCQALLDVRDGAVINLSQENSACMGGTYHLGLGPKPSGERDAALKKFLVQGEKLFCSLATFYRSQNLTSSPPQNLAKYVIFSPLGKARLKPDLVLFICNPEQACRIVTLAIYHEGIPPKVEMAGPSCHMAIAYPLVSGSLNVTLLDYTSRKMRRYKPEELIVSVPYHKMAGIVDSIKTCSAGVAKVEYPAEFRNLFRRGKKEV